MPRRVNIESPLRYLNIRLKPPLFKTKEGTEKKNTPVKNNFTYLRYVIITDTEQTLS